MYGAKRICVSISSMASRHVDPRVVKAGGHMIGSVGVRRLRRRFAAVLAAVGTMVILGGAIEAGAAPEAQAPVGLGTAKSFAVLAGTTVTNTGHSVISGDLGVSPGSAVTGFPPGKVIHGTEHVADAVALQAQSDLTTAYDDAAGRTPVTVVSTDLGGQTLAPGVYKSTSGLGLTGTVTLNAHGNSHAVFIFQAASTLITASSSTVDLVGGAQACNVFWQVGSSATLGTDTTFVGNILALTSASVQTRTTVDGRVLARNGQVSLDDNTITAPTCKTSPPPTTTTTTTTTTTPGGSTTTTTPGGSTTTTTVTPTTVPSSHTGEPWAGSPYWVLVGLLGFLGLVSLERVARIRRRRR
jgi:hypothetical protein